MRFPSRIHCLPDGLSAPPTELGVQGWQYHLAKHPLGVHALATQQPWNGEGWDALAPPVVTDDLRVGFLKQISTFAAGERGCGIPEFVGSGRSTEDPNNLACKRCFAPVLSRCAAALGDTPPGLGLSGRYAQVVEELLEAVSDARGQLVRRTTLMHVASKLVVRHRNAPEIFRGLVVGYLGWPPKRRDPSERRSEILRLQRYDGVRAEFYRNGDKLAFRTCYRQPRSTQNKTMTFLFDPPDLPDGKIASSENCIVARQWWETHGC